MKIGMAVLRALLGGLLIGHGTQKLFGWFGGHGPEGTGRFLESLGFRPGERHALLAGAAETAGGASLALGWMTPLGGAAVTGTIATALREVHAPRGPWITEGGWEYTAVILASVFAIVEAGPGPLSLDAARGRARWGPAWAIAQLAAGMAGSVATSMLARRRAADTGPTPDAPRSAPDATSSAPGATTA